MQGTHLHLQPHYTATANNYVQLDGSNCEGELRAAWLKEHRRTKRSDIVCNVYAYLKDNQAVGAVPIAASGSNLAVQSRGQPTATVFRRATQARIREQAERIAEQPDLQNLGAMTSAHLTRTLARQPPSNALIEIPRTATFRQMQSLDEGASRLHQRQTKENEERLQQLQLFEIEVAGVKVRIRKCLRSSCIS